jgi:glycerol-3-phosphate dehydrogenase
MNARQYMDKSKANSDQTDSNSLLTETDVAIIGGGVVGCAVARRMALEGASVVLLEKAADILDGASKGNSAILHTGFDAPVGTLEWECVQNGYREYIEIHQSLGLPLLKSGALVAAWTQEEEDRFEGILQKTGGEFDGSKWLLKTGRGIIKARYVINCAGLYGDILDHDVLGAADFTIKPRKGQFVVFDKAANKLIRSIILPVPTKRTKGIVLFPTIFGNMMVGPTAEEQDGRDDASVDETILKELRAQAIDKIPSLKNIPVTATYAGIRPATERPEYRVIEYSERNWITLGGIRSTGLTAALGIANHVYTLLVGQGAEYKTIETPSIPKVPNLAEHLPRDYEKSGYGEIVCHCEMVTQREIEAALESKAPAGSLDGLKRRTRVTMGRCQGFYCSARLAELTRGKFAESLGVGDADE